MLLKTKDTGRICHFVIDFPLMKFGQNYLDDQDIFDLLNHFDVPLTTWGISAESDGYSICSENALLQFSKSVFLLTHLKEKQHEYAKNRIRKEVNQQAQLENSRKNRKSSKKESQQDLSSFRCNPLQTAINAQYSKPSILKERNPGELISSVFAKKLPVKKSTDQIISEVRDFLFDLMSLADWMKENSSTAILDWIEVMHDLMDQALERPEYTDIDKYKFSIESANNGKENLFYVALKISGKFNVLPKWLQKNGFYMGLIK